MTEPYEIFLNGIRVPTKTVETALWAQPVESEQSRRIWWIVVLVIFLITGGLAYVLWKKAKG